MQAQFIPGSQGPLLGVYFPPLASSPHKADLLYIPPFAEEMNRSRWLVANAARRFGEAGFGTLIVDPYGTGDSAGDFVDARWDIWVEDVAGCLKWMREQRDTPCLLWGLRLGASLAVEASRAGAPCDGLVLWQPIVRGAQFIDQFLRIAVAEAVTKAHGARSVDGIRRALARNNETEVAGYRVHGDLIDRIDGIDLKDAGPAPVSSLSWIDVAMSEGATPRVDATETIAAWGPSSAVALDIAVAPQFWSLPEPEAAPGLIETTLRRLDAAQ